MTLTKEFLSSLDTRVGENLVVYDVAGRKVYFLHHHDTGFRLQQIRGKRRLPVKNRHLSAARIAAQNSRQSSSGKIIARCAWLNFVPRAQCKRLQQKRRKSRCCVVSLLVQKMSFSRSRKTRRKSCGSSKLNTTYDERLEILGIEEIKKLDGN